MATMDPIPQGFPHRTPIDIYEWQPVKDKPGLVEIARCKTYVEVFEEIEKRLTKAEKDKLDYFHVAHEVRGLNDTWPKRFQRLAVFPVTGRSEGHYVHVEVFHDDGGRECVYLAKTFEGWDWAWSFAKRLGAILGV